MEWSPILALFFLLLFVVELLRPNFFRGLIFGARSPYATTRTPPSNNQNDRTSLHHFAQQHPIQPNTSGQTTVWKPVAESAFPSILASMAPSMRTLVVAPTSHPIFQPYTCANHFCQPRTTEPRAAASFHHTECSSILSSAEEKTNKETSTTPIFPYDVIIVIVSDQDTCTRAFSRKMFETLFFVKLSPGGFYVLLYEAEADLWWIPLVDVINRRYYDGFYSLVTGDAVIQYLYVSESTVVFRRYRQLMGMKTSPIGHTRSSCPRSWHMLAEVELPNPTQCPTQKTCAPFYFTDPGSETLTKSENATLTFAMLSNALGSDKSVRHHYDFAYGFLLYPFMKQQSHCRTVKLMEIGVREFASMRLWKRFLPQATAIIGVDILKAYRSQDIYRIYVGDQASVPFLHELVEKEKDEAFDIIVDDGGHIFRQQQISFNVLFPSGLKRGGLYVIEDIETSYYRGLSLYGFSVCGGKGNPATTIEWAKAKLPSVLHGWHPTIQSMYFASGLIAFRKA